MKLKYTVIGVPLILLVILLGISWYFSSSMLYPSLRPCPVEHYVYCKTPEELQIHYEDISFQTIDGYILPGWYMPSGQSTEVILLIHGRGATRHEGMRYAKALLNAGFNLLAIDLRHRRQREGIICSMGYHEQKDIFAALDFLQNKKKLEAIGIKAGVFNSGFSKFENIIVETTKLRYGLPKYPLIPIVMKLYQWRGDLDVDELIPEKDISQISPRPVYIMHGTADKKVGIHHGERLYSAAKQPKQFWKVEGGKHTRLWQINRQKAENNVVEFFINNL